MRRLFLIFLGLFNFILLHCQSISYNLLSYSIHSSQDLRITYDDNSGIYFQRFTITNISDSIYNFNAYNGSNIESLYLDKNQSITICNDFNMSTHPYKYGNNPNSYYYLTNTSEIEIYGYVKEIFSSDNEITITFDEIRSNNYLDIYGDIVLKNPGHISLVYMAYANNEKLSIKMYTDGLLNWLELVPIESHSQNTRYNYMQSEGLANSFPGAMLSVTYNYHDKGRNINVTKRSVFPRLVNVDKNILMQAELLFHRLELHKEDLAGTIKSVKVPYTE